MQNGAVRKLTGCAWSAVPPEVIRIRIPITDNPMITRLKLKPGQRGTKALTEQYGDTLVCVRYRYDATNRTRIKTVELIVERKQLAQGKRRFGNEEIVPVRVAYADTELRNQIRVLGGRWDAKAKLWYAPYGVIKGTKLEQHILLDASAPKAPMTTASNIR